MKDRTKLPKWAQSEIERLERDLAHERARLAIGPDDSNTFADPYSDTPRPLGRDASVEFRFGPGTSEKIQCRIEGDKLHVYGGDLLTLFPLASNVVEIKTERWA